MTIINKKIYLVFILFIFIFSSCNLSNARVCINSDELIQSEWKVKKITFNKIDDDTYSMNVVTKYQIKNVTDKELWFYDIENGSIWQTSITRQNENLVEKKFILHKEYNGLLPYSVVFPKVIKIPPSKKIKGQLRLNYTLREGLGINKLSKNEISFNYFIFRKEILVKSFDDEIIFINAINNFCNEYYVKFD
jgi:hypothetical protein